MAGCLSRHCGRQSYNRGLNEEGRRGQFRSAAKPRTASGSQFLHSSCLVARSAQRCLPALGFAAGRRLLRRRKKEPVSEEAREWQAARGSNEPLSNERDSAELHLALVADAHCLEVMLLQKRLQARSRGRRIEFDLEVL